MLRLSLHGYSLMTFESLASGYHMHTIKYSQAMSE